MKSFKDSQNNMLYFLLNDDIDSDNNKTNSKYIKLPDGTLICYGWRRYENVNLITPWGNGYHALISDEFKYPIDFVGSPTVILTTESPFVSGVTITGSRGNVFPNIMITSFNDYTNIMIYVYYLAIGHWK